MALKNPSLLLYGFEVSTSNQYVDFQAVSGVTLAATLSIGSYTLSDYLVELVRALGAADPANTYTATVNRAIAGGLENRVTIATSGTFLSLLFGTGAHSVTSVAPVLGFGATDLTGATSYTAPASAGKSVVSVYPGYSYGDAKRNKLVFGSVNVSASGDKESIVWQLQSFPEIEFKFEPEAKVDAVWVQFFEWAIQQQPFEFTPDYTLPTTLYPVTLESTPESGKGLGYKMKEMIPSFPGLYQTGALKFRLVVQPSLFL